MLRIVIIIALVCISSVSPRADTGGALVVATCGTLPQAYAVGSTRSLTVNTNGQVCT